MCVCVCLCLCMCVCSAWQRHQYSRIIITSAIVFFNFIKNRWELHSSIAVHILHTVSRRGKRHYIYLWLVRKKNLTDY